MPKKLDHTSACEHLTRVDRQLARIIALWGPCSLQQETTQSIFEALLESIIYQQLNGKVAATITARVKALFPENTKRIRTRRGLVDGFPTPEQILAASEERLRSAGLSRAKMLAIRDLAAKALDGTVPTVTLAHRMSDEELIERLDTVRGIGRWTVEMLLIFRLGRPDVLPVDDYGVRKGFAKMRKLVKLPKPNELMAYGERWRPYRSVASWYMWRAAEMKDLPLAGDSPAPAKRGLERGTQSKKRVGARAKTESGAKKKTTGTRTRKRATK
jgi:3-methyladenine DNA glycosylase/8-oxoguanine DNA glycosylase